MTPNVSSVQKRINLAINPIRFKVLVVDQPGLDLDHVVEVLREVGYNVDAASDSGTTYRKLRNSVRPVDLLIIDLECLDEVEGLRFLQVLKKEECCTSTQVIITTHRLVDQRLNEVRDPLAIRACFNKSRPFEELLCLVTTLLPPSGHNLRASRRFPVKFMVDYTVGGNRQLCYANNLSLGGIFLRNSQPDPVDTLAKLTFTLPGHETQFKPAARVVRVVEKTLALESPHHQTFPQGNGLVFVEMPAEHQRLLKEFCDQEETRIFGMPATGMPLPETHKGTR